ncbi:MAG: reverse transcriptase domain-containing protein [Patescibacteria group bacterium]
MKAWEKRETIDKSYGLSWFTRDIEGVPHAEPSAIVRDGKKRLVLVPNEAMEKVHKKLINCLRNEMSIHKPNVVCGPRISGNMNAIRHATNINKRFFKLDLKNAFLSVRAERLAQMIVRRFDDLGTEVEVRKFLEEYCFDERTGGLAQGLPASNELFDFYCEVLIDGPIRDEIDMKWAGGLFDSLVFTRYVDDLLISNYEPIPEGLIRRVREIISKAGFKENHRKTKFHDATKNGPMTITGRALDQHGAVSLPGKYLRRLEGVLWVAAHRPKDCQVSWAELMGHMQYFEHVMSARIYLTRRQTKILKLFSEWAIKQKIDCAGLAELANKGG